MDLTSVIIAVVAIAVLGIMIYLVPIIRKWAAKNNVPIEKILDSAESMTKIAEGIAKQMFPAQAAYIDMVAKVAQLAVKYAEQLYLSGKIQPEERKDKAIEFVKMSLVDAGVDVTNKNEDFIEAVVESTVFLLPKTHKEE